MKGSRRIIVYPVITHFPGETAVLASGPGAFNELQVPLGFSYRCFSTEQYPLMPTGGTLSSTNTNASIVLKSFQLQPYVDDSRIFGEGTLNLTI